MKFIKLHLMSFDECLFSYERVYIRSDLILGFVDSTSIAPEEFVDEDYRGDMWLTEIEMSKMRFCSEVSFSDEAFNFLNKIQKSKNSRSYIVYEKPEEILAMLNN